MTTTLANPLEEMQAHLKAARDIAAKADEEGREFSDEESGQLRELMGKASDAKARAEKAKGDAAIKAAIAGLGDEIGLNEKSKEWTTPSGLIVPKGKSIGQHYVSSPEWKELQGSAPGGTFSKQHRVSSRPVGFERLIAPRGQKALVTGVSDTSAGAFVKPDDLGLQGGLELFQRPLTLRQLCTPGTTTSDAIEYTQVTSITNNAAPVPEATSSAMPTAPGSAGALVQNAGGGYKPESGFALGAKTTNVKTIAHWIPVTKRALADAAQIVTLIDNFLEYGLEEELEDQIVAGNGTGENFLGIANVSGVQAQAAVADPSGKPAGFGMLLSTRRAKTKVKKARAKANAYVINPDDWETFEEMSDADGHFYGDGPFTSGDQTSLWGLPVIESEAIPAGTAYVGDWTKSILYDRQQATITTTDSHGDFFVRNLVAVLAELRAAYAVIQPSAFVQIDLTV
jgi:HK97 family phage major capsid protein